MLNDPKLEIWYLKEKFIHMLADSFLDEFPNCLFVILPTKNMNHLHTGKPKRLMGFDMGKILRMSQSSKEMYFSDD